jgi:hypothetical protein
VVKNIKKIYNIPSNEENTDVAVKSYQTDLLTIDRLIKTYKATTNQGDQNNYSNLYKDLNPYFTPFEMINSEDTRNILIEKEVGNDLNTIIDNLNEMYSSVISNSTVKSRRFVVEKYNLGLNKLDTIDSTSSRLITVKTSMTTPDTMSIKSFVTLPEPTIRFSKINLPGTSLLDKSNLNLIFLNYWQLLKKNTNINNVFIDNLNHDIEFNENNFVNNIKNYVFNLSQEETKTFTKEEIYNRFVDIIIPKTKILFNLIKKYINGKLSIIDVVGYLEPFLIYTDDLTYMQYVEITDFINSKIGEYNKKYIERSRFFSNIGKITSNPIIESKAYSIINIISQNKNFRQEVFNEGYGINIENNIFTNSELLRKILLKDYSRLYTTALSYQNIPLMFPNEISSIFEEEEKDIDKKLKNEENDDKCKTFTIAKMYHSLEELNSDNNKTIYFDLKYDKTNYGLLEDKDGYMKEVISMSPEDLKTHITQDLMNKKKFNELDADYLATTLIDGHKKVIDGQYALLYKGFKENVLDEVDYYVRKENKWVIDKELSGKINTDESAILCDLQEKCINVTDKIDDKCESIKSDELGLQHKLLKDILSDFDTKYKMSKEQFIKNIQETLDYNMNIISILSKMEATQMLKYNNQKYKLGIELNDDSSKPSISPNAKLLNLIIGQTDFVKKQHDIIRFVNTYTRPYRSNVYNENSDWLYCLQTNVPLVPIFKYNLAAEYVTNPSNYMSYLEIVKSKIGKLSDDGDMWVDKESGWTICRIDLDIEEGYEEGFKIISRDVLESDAGNKIMSSNIKTVLKYTTPETIMINNIINAISIAIGINIENQKEFIINTVLTSLKDTLETEEDYKDKIKQMAQKGKKIASYKDFYNTAFLYYTIGTILIGIQTSIPSIKTRKTHPGCVRSFSGYPFEGTGDLSSLTYIGCVAYDIRDSGEPWYVIKGKTKDYVINKIKTSIDGVLLENADVKRKFEEKTEYLLTNPATEIPEEHDIAKWSQFLPPLVPFKITHLTNISDDFKRGLMSDLRNGTMNQREKLLVIDSKIIKFSLAIQELIQNIIKKHKTILNNVNNEPYIENSCCDTNNKESTIEYFIKQNPEILQYNNIVKNLTNIIEDVISYSKAGIFFSNINTKNNYPLLSNHFNEKTIYLSFIYFCKFKTLVPIPEELIPICTNKPETSLINSNDSIDRIIQKLKDDGRNYTNEQFLRLLQLIGRKNIINLDLKTPEISSITRLVGLLEAIDDENDEVVERSLRETILNVLDTFDIATEKLTSEVKTLNTFLIKGIETMREELIEFIERNKGPNITKKSIKNATQFISSMADWSSNNSTRHEDIKISNDNNSPLFKK